MAAVNIKNNFVALATAVALLLSVSVRAELVSTAGGLGVYDTVNNVTWASDFNLMATQAANYPGGFDAFVATIITTSGGVIYGAPTMFDNVPYSGTYTLTAGVITDRRSLLGDNRRDFYPNGSMSWFAAQAWIKYLNYISYAGSNMWALPSTVDDPASLTDGRGSHPAASSSQMAQLFLDGLGQNPSSGLKISHNSAYDLFSGALQTAYRSGTEYSIDPDYNYQVWQHMEMGLYQYRENKFGDFWVLAVAPGQVGALSAVPVPGAIWLLGSGLLGVLGLRRRKAQNLVKP